MVALIALVVVSGMFLSDIVTNPEPDTSSDSPDAQEPEPTDESAGSNEESGSSDTGTAEGSGDTTQSSTVLGGQDSDSNNQDSGLQYGETYTRPDGVEITVGSPETIDSFSANGITQTPEEGNIFVQVYVTARNTADEEKILPYRIDFDLIFQNRQYESAPFAHLKDDVYEGTDVQPGIVRDGSIVFETTEEADLSEIEIVWSSSDESATWSSS